MTIALKIRPVGNSLGLILPQEALAQLNVSAGDSVYLTQGPEGFQVVANDPDFARAMDLYRKGANRYRNALKELAK
jgi:putative addiction module antidote